MRILVNLTLPSDDLLLIREALLLVSHKLPFPAKDMERIPKLAEAIHLAVKEQTCPSLRPKQEEPLLLPFHHSAYLQKKRE